jgi:hypothetical protein
MPRKPQMSKDDIPGAKEKLAAVPIWWPDTMTDWPTDLGRKLSLTLNFAVFGDRLAVPLWPTTVVFHLKTETRLQSPRRLVLK